MRLTERCALALALATTMSPSAANPTPDLAALFGTRPAATGMAISPDATRLLYIAPAGSGGSAVVVLDVASGTTRIVLSSTTASARPDDCFWKSETRLVCRFYGVVASGNGLLPVTRILAVDADGNNVKQLGQRSTVDMLGANQFSGKVIDTLADDPGHVLMQIEVAEQAQWEGSGGSNIRRARAGMSVQRVDIRTNAATIVESPNPIIREFGTDGHGSVRYRATGSVDPNGYLREAVQYAVRGVGDRNWKSAGASSSAVVPQFEFEGFDDTGGGMLTRETKDGREALFRLATDGSGTRTLVFAHALVDVDGVLRIGKYQRPVAVRYTVDAPQYEYFDPVLLKLTRSLSAALPDHPDVVVLDESWDRTKLLVASGQGGTPGTYYLFDSATHKLAEVLSLRPGLQQSTLATVKAVRYPAADGTMIPGYLTLPPGVPPTRLRAIVMPHGGPSARDTGGFDWLAQYYAAIGYAVLQPNFRGSSGYGAAWYRSNGFKSWATAIGDVNDGARWLVTQGIAEGARLAIVGWSYGGYAALQANVLDPGLYKAAVAVAPVTDLAGMKMRALNYTNALQVAAFIGDGPHVSAGSPARNAGRFRAPVLLFSGDRDLNVDVSQSRLMATALGSAGKPYELKIYPGLDHQLDDSEARADLLRRSTSFLDAALK